MLDIDYTNRTKELYYCIDSHRQYGRAPLNKNDLYFRYRYSDSQKQISCTIGPIAQSIISDISYTDNKIAKLGLLFSKGLALLPEKQSEIVKLVDTIEIDLTDCNKSINKLSGTIKNNLNSLGFSPKNQFFRHYESLIYILQSFLASITMIFRDIVIKNKEIITEITIKYEESTQEIKYEAKPLQNQTQTTNFFVPQQAPVYNNILLDPHEQEKLLRSGPKEVPSYQNNQNGQIFHYQQQLTVEQNSKVIPAFEQEIRQRDMGMRRVEQTIVQLGEINTQFAVLVAEQGEVVNRIDNYIDDSYLNIESAHGYLVEFLKNASNRRYFIYKIFIALILCAFLFLYFIK